MWRNKRYIDMPAAMLGFFLGLLVISSGFPASLRLERGFPRNDWVEISKLRARDMARHGRILKSSDDHIIDFPVQGTYDPYLVGLYFTRVQLGSPPKEFYVQIDTGSDVLWVGCKTCDGCPKSSGLQIDLEPFDPSSSSTASLISCSDDRCALGAQTSDSYCSREDDQCIYSFQYGDGSGASGFYVSDIMHLDTIVRDSPTSNTSANVVFGCSTSQTGDLSKPDRAVDGIFGFGQQSLSIVSQLSSQGITPDAFSHCLKGGETGGGILVFGQIVEPNLVYTPLVPSQPHYNINLQSISVDGKKLLIDSSVFATSDDGGTIIDSGTTLAYLVEEAYDPFVDAITEAVSQSATPVVSKGSQCYFITGSVSEIFPTVNFNFYGGAPFVLKPEDYLLQQNSADGATAWCIGFQKMNGTTIIGDLFLKDKIIVYDLGGQRIGWADYDCSMPVNVSTARRPKRSGVFNTVSGSSSQRDVFLRPITLSILFVILHISVHFSLSCL
ncbi:aspartic proteinase 36 [Daucus carota subsp. sativus]